MQAAHLTAKLDQEAVPFILGWLGRCGLAGLNSLVRVATHAGLAVKRVCVGAVFVPCKTLASPARQLMSFRIVFPTREQSSVVPLQHLSRAMQLRQLSQRVTAAAACCCLLLLLLLLLLLPLPQVSAAEALIGALSLDIPGEAPFSSTLIDNPHLARYWQVLEVRRVCGNSSCCGYGWCSGLSGLSCVWLWLVQA
jgi:hypothetical protein